MGKQQEARRQNLRALAFVAVAALFYAGVRLGLGVGGSCAGSTEDAPSASASALAAGSAPSGAPSGSATAGRLTELPKPVDPILYAEVERRPAPAPPRFGAELPQRVEDFQAFLDNDAKYPPPAHVEDRICLGDADMQERFDSALAAAAKAGASPAQLVDSYGHLVEWCRTDGACGWGRSTVTGRTKAAVRAVGWHALTRCSGEDVADLFDRRDVPDEQLIEYLSRTGETAEYSKRIERAALKVVGTGTTADVRRAAFVLGATDHPRAAAALLDLHAETSDAERAAAIALAMYRQSDPRAQAAFEQACRARAEEPVCRSRGSAGTPAAAGSGSGSAEAAAPAADPAELRSCVETDESPAEQYACLVELVAADRKLAAETVRGPEGKATLTSPHADLAELAGSVSRHPSTDSLKQHLVQLGLVDEAAPPTGAEDESAPHLTARELLAATHRIHRFDAETDEFPNHHDSLLRYLAAMGGESLAALLFAEDPPAEDQPRAYYQLLAYVKGEELTTTARNLGDWYDIRAVVGLLNTLARELGTDLRFVVLGTSDQMVAVAVGPELGLRQAISEGLLAVAAADQAMTRGREVERQLQTEPE